MDTASPQQSVSTEFAARMRYFFIVPNLKYNYFSGKSQSGKKVFFAAAGTRPNKFCWKSSLLLDFSFSLC